MGWKSTIAISRRQAIRLIKNKLEESSNQELEDTLENIGYGDNVELSYFGHNFRVLDTDDEAEEYNK